MLNDLNSDNLINLMKKERKLNIVFDNVRIHTSKVVEMTYDMLTIDFIFFTPLLFISKSNRKCMEWCKKRNL